MNTPKTIVIGNHIFNIGRKIKKQYCDINNPQYSYLKKHETGSKNNDYHVILKDVIKNCSNFEKIELFITRDKNKIEFETVELIFATNTITIHKNVNTNYLKAFNEKFYILLKHWGIKKVNGKLVITKEIANTGGVA